VDHPSGFHVSRELRLFNVNDPFRKRWAICPIPLILHNLYIPIRFWNLKYDLRQWNIVIITSVALSKRGIHSDDPLSSFRLITWPLPPRGYPPPITWKRRGALHEMWKKGIGCILLVIVMSLFNQIVTCNRRCIICIFPFGFEIWNMIFVNEILLLY
jgi:hypothetical protein